MRVIIYKRPSLGSSKYALSEDQIEKIKSRTKREMSDLALRSEYARHPKPITLPKLKFLEKNERGE